MSPVSVAIPTWNAGSLFEEVLVALRHQRDVGPVDLVVVDSQSDDGTVELARKFGARCHVIDRRTFDHGATRNLAAVIAQGESIAFLSQDAQPADDHWLAALVEALESEAADGAYSRVLPRPDCHPLVERSVKADLVYRSEREVKRCSPEELSTLQAFERRVFFHFNNVASAVRRSSFKTRPFPRMRFGEDLAWGGRVIEQGGTLVFEPASKVLHSHSPSLREDFRRHAADARLMRVLFGFRNRDSWLDCLPAWREAWREDRQWLRDHATGLARRKALLLSPFLRASQIAGQRWGSLGQPIAPPVFSDRLPPVPGMVSNESDPAHV